MYGSSKSLKKVTISDNLATKQVISSSMQSVNTEEESQITEEKKMNTSTDESDDWESDESER